MTACGDDAADTGSTDGGAGGSSSTGGHPATEDAASSGGAVGSGGAPTTGGDAAAGGSTEGPDASAGGSTADGGSDGGSTGGAGGGSGGNNGSGGATSTVSFACQKTSLECSFFSEVGPNAATTLKNGATCNTATVTDTCPTDSLIGHCVGKSGGAYILTQYYYSQVGWTQDVITSIVDGYQKSCTNGGGTWQAP